MKPGRKRMFSEAEQEEILRCLMAYHANHPKRLAGKWKCSEETIRLIWRRHMATVVRRLAA